MSLDFDKTKMYNPGLMAQQEIRARFRTMSRGYTRPDLTPVARAFTPMVSNYFLKIIQN